MPVLTAYAEEAPNLILNPSAETLSAGTPTNWTPTTWGTSNTTLSTTSGAQDGSVALAINTTSRTSGDAKWMPTPVDVTAGTTYTFSDYSKSSVATEIDAAYTDASGTISYYYLASVQSSTNWQKNTVSLTVPASAVKVAILHILYTAGTLTTDNYSLTDNSAPVTPPTTPPATPGNLIANPSFETASGNDPANWTPGSWGTNNASFTYVTNDGHTGVASAKVQIGSYTDGDAKWYFAPAAVQSGTDYTFSDYYKATTPTSLVARFDNGSGGYSYSQIAAPAAASNWTQVSASFTTPATAKFVTLFHLLSGVGTLQIDDASLTGAAGTPDPTPTQGNLIPNPSVEIANGNKPADWTTGKWGTNNASFTYITNGGHDGTASVKVQIGTYASGSAYWRTAVPQNIIGGQLYAYRDYYQSNVETELSATITLSNGSQQDIWLGSAFASPNGWSKFEAQFTAPKDAVSIVFYHDIFSAGYLTTDSYSLTPFAYQGFARALVSITDDDGFANFYTNGLPILQKYGLPSTAYIISGYLDAPGYLTASQVVALHGAGVEIGSHSVDHQDLTKLTPAQQQAELQDSQTTLQNLLGIPVTQYAAPYGAHNDQLTALAAKYYQGYRSTDLGYNAANNFDILNMRVQNVTDTTTLADVQSWLQQAAATKTWLILVYHQINTDPAQAGEYSVTPTAFDAQMAAVKASGITVKTVSEALNELLPQL